MGEPRAAGSRGVSRTSERASDLREHASNRREHVWRVRERRVGSRARIGRDASGGPDKAVGRARANMFPCMFARASLALITTRMLAHHELHTIVGACGISSRPDMPPKRKRKRCESHAEGEHLTKTCSRAIIKATSASF